MNWRAVKPAAVMAILGSEEYLAEWAIRSVRNQLREANPMLEIHEVSASEYEPATIANLATPSLFAEPRLIVFRQVEKCNDAFLQEALEALEVLIDDVTLIFRHDGSSVRGKKLLEKLRATKGVVEISCDPIKKDADRAAFVQAEFAGRPISNEVIRSLLEAFGDDLAELASACSQLLQDSAEAITPELVDAYFGGRVETSSFKVADAAIAGDEADALRLLRHALATGVDPVPLLSALASKAQQLAKVFSNRNATAAQLGMQPWMLDKVRRSVGGWSDEGLRNVIIALADTDAAIKGAERDPGYSLEKMVQLLAAKGKR
jgi:DNA polymerase-3 subunit delta